MQVSLAATVQSREKVTSDVDALEKPSGPLVECILRPCGPWQPSCTYSCRSEVTSLQRSTWKFMRVLEALEFSKASANVTTVFKVKACEV